MVQNRFDQHLHSSFSFDADPGHAIDCVAETAIAKGLAGIAITDHLDPLWPNKADPTLDLTAYESALTAAEKAYADRIRLAKGIELGLMPGEALAICERTVSGYPFDFVIASVHNSAELPIHIPAFFGGRPLREVIDEYYTILRESIRAYKNYDIIGHINVIDRYTDRFADERVYMPYIDEILRLLVADGKGIEVNTSAFRYGLADRGTPTMAILKRFKEVGGEIVTIGSDAHKAKDIGAHIEKGEEWLLASGFKYVAVFSNRQPDFAKI